MNPRFIFVIFLFLISLSVNAQLFNEQGLKFMRIFDWINNRYVDSVNIDKFSDSLIKDALHKLDPHSAYLTKEEVEELNEPLEGNFDGIGVTFQMMDDTAYVISSIPDGPSEKVGIEAGDRIIKIEGENVAGVGISSKQITSRLKGKRGSIVNVDVKRRSENVLLSFAITRDKIPIYSIDASYKIDPNTGYIRLSRFSHTTLKEFESVISNFRKEKVTNLILDLSGNGGGYFDVAVSLADEFLKGGKMIVYTQGIHSPKKGYVATSKGLFEDGKLVIIIDEGSASASEIVAGAVQDWDRGIIVGRRSYGKGLVQSQLFLPDESVVRLTIARYYTPTGRLIQKNYVNGYSDYTKELTRRYKHGEYYHKDSIHLPDSLKFYTMAKKRLVYGGGGIMPDVFVPVDTSYYSNYYRNIISNGIINLFALQLVDKHRDEFRKKYNDFSVFNKEFSVDPSMMNDLIKFANDKSISFNPDDFVKSKNALSVYLKASIARNLWNSEAFFEVINQMNPSVLRATEVVNNWKNYSK